MIFSHLTDYLRRHRRVNVDVLALGIGSTPEAVSAMLAVLERKGRVRCLPAGSTCGSASCCKCDPATLTIYEWIGDDDRGEY